MHGRRCSYVCSMWDVAASGECWVELGGIAVLGGGAGVISAGL